MALYANKFVFTFGDFWNSFLKQIGWSAEGVSLWEKQVARCASQGTPPRESPKYLTQRRPKDSGGQKVMGDVPALRSIHGGPLRPQEEGVEYIQNM
jgi:hypothetical protein